MEELLDQNKQTKKRDNLKIISGEDQRGLRNFTHEKDSVPESELTLFRCLGVGT